MSIPRDPIEWEQTIRGLRPSSPAWVAFTKATYGTPLSPEERELFLQLSGGREPDPGGHDRVFALKGRRGGGSETVSRWCVYEAIHGGHHRALAPGQTGVEAIACPEIKHAKEVLGYVKGLAELPDVARHVVRVVDNEVTFRNRIAIRVVVASEMAVAATLVMLVLDECARLPGEESAMPDQAFISTVVPGLAPIRGAPPRRMVAVTAPFVDGGWAHGIDQRDFGRHDAEFLVVRGSTELFNPNISTDFLEAERRSKGVSALREYGRGPEPPEWMSSVVESWFGQGVPEGCVDRGRRSTTEPQPGWEYVFTVDFAFSNDNVGICAAARRGDRTIIAYVDALHPPPGGTLSPRRTVDHIVGAMRDLGASEVYIDQYCAPVLIEAFEDRGVECIQIPWTGGKGETSKASKYRAVREAMRDGLVRLPDGDPALIRELNRVRGHMTQSGNESISAPGKGVDDRVSAVVMACGVAHEGAGGGSVPEWCKPGAMRGMAQAIQDMGGSAFSPASLGRNATAPFPDDAPAGGRGLSMRRCWNGEVEISSSAGDYPARFTAIAAPGAATRFARECHQWGPETFARFARAVDDFRARYGL